MTAAAPPVLVMGAGAVGCFVGGALLAAGAAVTFVGRARVLDALRRHGLTLTDLDGLRTVLPAAALDLADEVPAGAAPALVLLAVKGGATADAAATLGARLAAADDPALRSLAPLFERAGLPLALHADMAPVLWAKLLLNLNNPVNALSGRPLRAPLLDRSHRRVLAALQDEALRWLDAAGIAPARLTPLPARRVPALLRLPTPLFRLVAARTLRIDERARSSMADDLRRGRATEVDLLCGEVVRLATSLGGAAPLNARIAALVNDWPRQPRDWHGRALATAIGLG